jgi:hypothetical protein
MKFLFFAENRRKILWYRAKSTQEFLEIDSKILGIDSLIIWRDTDTDFIGGPGRTRTCNQTVMSGRL